MRVNEWPIFETITQCWPSEFLAAYFTCSRLRKRITNAAPNRQMLLNVIMNINARFCPNLWYPFKYHQNKDNITCFCRACVSSFSHFAQLKTDHDTPLSLNILKPILYMAFPYFWQEEDARDLKTCPSLFINICNIVLENPDPFFSCIKLILDITFVSHSYKRGLCECVAFPIQMYRFISSYFAWPTWHINRLFS